MSHNYSVEEILNHFIENSKYKYDIKFCFTLSRNDINKIEETIDNIAGNIIPRTITMDIDGDYYHIVWLQEILDEDKYYSIYSSEENNNINFNITIHGYLHKIYHTTINNSSFQNSNFIGLY